MSSVGDALAYPFRDPGWVGKVLVQGLILIIPILGAIALLGWMMMTYDNLKAGRTELPQAGFHLGRGINIFVVELVYYIVLYIPYFVLVGLGAAASQNESNVGAPFIALGYAYQFVASMLIAFLLPAIFVNTYNGGIGGGLNVGAVWQMSTANLSNTVIAALMMILAGIIGSLGIIACCIGVFFTLAYSGLIITGVAVWFERVQSAPPAPAAAA